MLTFKRKRNESVIIAGNVRLRVERIGERSVYLSIDAPREVQVDREEVHLLRQAQKGKSDAGSGN